VVPYSRDCRSQLWPYHLYQWAGGWSSENQWPFRPEAPLRAERDEDKFFTKRQAAGGAFQIGRNLDELPAAATRPIPASYSFDGIIDELKIYGRALDASEIKRSYDSLRPTSPPPLTWRKLPSIPDGQKRFGEFYTSLKFYPEWDLEMWG